MQKSLRFHLKLIVLVLLVSMEVFSHFPKIWQFVYWLVGVIECAHESHAWCIRLQTDDPDTLILTRIIYLQIMN